jgi:hypothetical protein
VIPSPTDDRHEKAGRCDPPGFFYIGDDAYCGVAVPPVVVPAVPPIVPVVEVPPIVPVVPPPMVPVVEPVPVPVVPPIVSEPPIVPVVVPVLPVVSVPVVDPPVRLLRLLRDFLAERLWVVVPEVAEESVGEVVV